MDSRRMLDAGVHLGNLFETEDQNNVELFKVV